LRCEVCGRKSHSDPVRAVIEGAKLTVCVECSKHGRVLFPEEDHTFRAPVTITTAGSVRPKKPVALVQKKKLATPQVQLTQEIIEGYASAIRVAREKLGLSVEDLGLKINEKASVLRHIENGKMPPNNLLANKLERTLKIQLLIPVTEEKETEIPKAAANQEVTLGDLIEIEDKKGAEELKERKQS
jgi:putative transcription factor